MKETAWGFTSAAARATSLPGDWPASLVPLEVTPPPLFLWGSLPLEWAAGSGSTFRTEDWNEDGMEVEKRTGWWRGRLCSGCFSLLCSYSWSNKGALSSCTQNSTPGRLVTWAGICPEPFLLFKWMVGNLRSELGRTKKRIGEMKIRENRGKEAAKQTSERKTQRETHTEKDRKVHWETVTVHKAGEGGHWFGGRRMDLHPNASTWSSAKLGKSSDCFEPQSSCLKMGIITLHLHQVRCQRKGREESICRWKSSS